MAAVTMPACTELNPAFQADGGVKLHDAAPPGRDAATTLETGTPLDADVDISAPAVDFGGTIDAGICGVGTVTFQLNLAATSTRRWCVDSCGAWVSVRTAAGQTLSLPRLDDCSIGCDTCTLGPCSDVACGPQRILWSGVRTQWQGIYAARGRCGDNVACREPRCAPPGRYVAVICAAATKLGACDPYTRPTCAEVPFELPNRNSVVQAILR